MEFDYNKLNGKIREVCKTQNEFSKRLGISEASVNYKLNNKSFFTQQQISKTLEILNINPKEIHTYFFTPKVEKN